MVDDAHVADGAGLENVHLLHLVQQLQINFLPDLHVTGQTQHFLLHFRQFLYLLVNTLFFFQQRVAFFQQRNIGRMRLGKLLRDIRFFEGQLVKLGFQRHHGIQRRFCFEVEIDRFILLAVAVELLLGAFQ